MKVYYLLFFILLLPATLLLGQKNEVTMYGQVIDTLVQPLPYATIIATPKDTIANVHYTLTDKAGKYRLMLKKEHDYTIEIRFLGFETYTFTHKAITDTPKDIVLIAAAEQLAAVELHIELPVRVRGDTTSYAVNRFVTGEERKLKTLLKKLPQVEVLSNGEVLVKGKKVTTLLVDGKKFFNGGTKLAIDHLPSNAIQTIEVIDNYNPITFLKGISDSNAMAMNVVLKEDKKKLVFGDLTTGIGNRNFYKAHANLFYYSPKTNITAITNTNTIGEKTLTFKDYLNFQGGVNVIFENDFDWKATDVSLFIEGNDAVQSNQKFAALHLTQDSNPKMRISSYLLYATTDTQNYTNIENIYPTFREQVVDTALHDNQFMIGQLLLKYSPSLKEQWSTRTQVKVSDLKKHSAISSTIDTQQNILITKHKTREIHINQSLEWHKKQHPKHTFSALATYRFDQTPQRINWQSTDPLFPEILQPIAMATSQQLQQRKEQQQQYLQLKGKHFWLLAPNHHLYTNIGTSFIRENSNTLGQQISEDTINLEGFENDIKHYWNDTYMGLYYKFKTGMLTLKTGANLHYYDWNIKQDIITSNDRWVILPELLGSLKLTAAKKITFSTQLKTTFPEAIAYSNNSYFQSYNSLAIGNQGLKEGLYSLSNIRYSSQSLYRGLNLFINARYQKNLKGKIPLVNFQGNNRIVSSVQSTNFSERLEVKANITKKINQIAYRLKTTTLFNSYQQIIEGNRETYSNTSYLTDLKITTHYKKLPKLSIGFKNNIGTYKTGTTNTRFLRQTPYLRISHRFFKTIQFQLNYDYIHYQNKTINQNSTYQETSATISYAKENSPWSFNFKANNILNNTFKRQNTFTEYLISDYRIGVTPSMLLLSVGYDF